MHLNYLKSQSFFSFKGLCDFQYLPMAMQEDGTYHDITDKVELPNILDSKDNILEKDDSIPLYLPPLAFSRTDIPQDYYFRREVRDERVTHPGIQLSLRKKLLNYSFEQSPIFGFFFFKLSFLWFL